jgi:putative ABC transport system permease protein
VKLIGISLLLAAPISWYIMNRWLQDFAYRIDMGAGLFIWAGLASLIIALLTVSYYSVKAAVLNPVDSLRNE